MTTGIAIARLDGRPANASPNDTDLATSDGAGIHYGRMRHMRLDLTRYVTASHGDYTDGLIARHGDESKHEDTRPTVRHAATRPNRTDRRNLTCHGESTGARRHGEPSHPVLDDKPSRADPVQNESGRQVNRRKRMPAP